MLTSTRFEITNHFRERYVERNLEGKLPLQDNRIIRVSPSDTYDPTIRRLVDTRIRKDFLGSRTPTPAERRALLSQWVTPTGDFHPSNIVLYNPFTRTMFVCEPKRVGVFVGRTCFRLQEAEQYQGT
jgi:hypothetical protein